MAEGDGDGVRDVAVGVEKLSSMNGSIVVVVSVKTGRMQLPFASTRPLDSRHASTDPLFHSEQSANSGIPPMELALNSGTLLSVFQSLLHEAQGKVNLSEFNE